MTKGGRNLLFFSSSSSRERRDLLDIYGGLCSWRRWGTAASCARGALSFFSVLLLCNCSTRHLSHLLGSASLPPQLGSSVVSFDCWCVTISSLQDNDDFDGKTALASHGSVASAHLDCPYSASLNKQKVLWALRSYGPKLFLSHWNE